MVNLERNKHTEHNFKKRFGQNFLRDKTVIDRILSNVVLTPDDLVIEIGPGEGAMTRELIKKTRVLAYEVDTELKKAYTSEEFKDNLEIIWSDFLKRDVREDIKNYKYDKLFLIANLPYYITTPIIVKLIEEKLQFDCVIVMVQKEVAERFSSLPGSKKYSSITVFLNYYFDIEKLFDVNRKSFYPVPNVDSAVIRLNKKEKPFEVNDEKLFFSFIRDSFKYKRKTLKNNIGNYDSKKVEEVLKKYNKDLSIRAECIPIDLFVEIVNNLK